MSNAKVIAIKAFAFVPRQDEFLSEWRVSPATKSNCSNLSLTCTIAACGLANSLPDNFASDHFINANWPEVSISCFPINFPKAEAVNVVPDFCYADAWPNWESWDWSRPGTSDIDSGRIFLDLHRVKRLPCRENVDILHAGLPLVCILTDCMAMRVDDFIALFIAPLGAMATKINQKARLVWSDAACTSIDINAMMLSGFTMLAHLETRCPTQLTSLEEKTPTTAKKVKQNRNKNQTS